jgi:hypothetical protein
MLDELADDVQLALARNSSFYRATPDDRTTVRVNDFETVGEIVY